MALAVGDVGDKFFRRSFRISEQAVDGLDHHLDKVDVFPLVEAADIVGFGRFSLMEDKVDFPGVVLDE